jgi:hypothetical protein
MSTASSVVDVTLEWTITGHGSAQLTWSAGDAVIPIRTTYMGDGLRSLLRAANDLKLGSRATFTLLLREPSGHAIFFSGADREVHAQIVFFPYMDHSEDRRWSGGELKWSGRVGVGSLLLAARHMAESVLEHHGLDGYLRDWEMPFPTDELARLQSAERGNYA